MPLTGTSSAKHLHHPWRAFSRFTDWRLRWAQLPDGHYGLTCHRTRTVTIAEGLSQAERRCTIAHETQHIIRGPQLAGTAMREELDIDRTVARLLAPSIIAVGDALAWSHGRLEEAADDLWIDDLMMNVRLSALLPTERRYLQQRLSEVWLG
jgi:hypothetical protein